MQLITKIKFVNNHRTQINLTDNDNEKLPKTVVIHSEEGNLRHPDFDTAMAALIPWGLSYFGFPKEYNERVTLNTINLKRHDKTGLSVQFSFYLNYVGVISNLDNRQSKINGGSSLTVPEIHEDLGETGFNKMPQQIHDAVVKLMNEAEKFLGGKFAQADLFSEEDDDIAANDDVEEKSKKKNKKKAA